MLLTESLPNGATLSIDVDPVTAEIRDVNHDVFAGEALKDLAKSVVGLTVYQAAIDGADRVLRRTIGAGGMRPVAGILSVANAGAQYLELDDVLRRLLRQYKDVTGGPVPRKVSPGEEEWDSLAMEEQIRRLTAAIAAFEESIGVKRGTVAMEALERDVSNRPVRLVVAVLGEGVPAQMPALIRKLERHVRETVGQQIEVLVDERQDRNKLRRTIVVKTVGNARA